jgi:hypothetical protein
MRRGGRHREAYPLHRITIWIRDGDWQWLQARWRYDASRVIRELIIRYRREIEDLEAPRAAEEWNFDLENL